MTTVTCWTATDLETQPRVRTTAPGVIEATFLVGVWSVVSFGAVISPRAEIWDGGAWQPVDNRALRWTEISIDELTRRDRLANDPDRSVAWLESTRHLADIRNHLNRQGDPDHYPPSQYPPNRYFEVVVSRLPAGRLLRFAAEAVFGGGPARATSNQTALWLTAPEFSAADLVGTHVFGDDDAQVSDQWWVLMHQADDDFEHLRLDLLMTHNLTRQPSPASNLAPLRISLDGVAFDVATTTGAGPGPIPDDYVSLQVDRSTDSVLITRRRPVTDLHKIVITTRADGQQQEETLIILAAETHDLSPVG